MDELTWLQQRESMLQHTSSLKVVLIVTTEIFRSQHKNKMNREKRGRDTTSKSRQKFQHKCTEKSCCDRENRS